MKKFYFNDATLISILIIFWLLIYLPNLGTIPITSQEAVRLSVSFSINDISGLFKADLLGHFYSNKPPVYSFIIFLFTKLISGTIEFVSRLPSAVSVLIIAIISFLRLKWLDKLSTFFICLLIIISPFSMYYGRIVQNDMAFGGLVFLSILELISFYEFERNKSKLIFCGALQGLAVLIKGPFGLVMLLGIILLKSISFKEIIEVSKIVFLVMFLITTIYFSITFLNGYLSFDNLLDELLTRFKRPLGPVRMIGERILSIFYALPIFMILFPKNKISERSILQFILNLGLILISLLFILPGYQADYILPIAILTCVPSGYVLACWVKSKDYKKLFVLSSYFIIFISLYIYILPPIISQSMNGNTPYNLMIEKIEEERLTNKKTNILISEGALNSAPYLYSVNKNFNINRLSKSNIDEQKIDLKNEYFIISAFDLPKTKNLLKIKEIKCVNLEKIANTKFKSSIFEWPYKGKNNLFHQRRDLNLFKVMKCF